MKNRLIVLWFELEKNAYLIQELSQSKFLKNKQEKQPTAIVSIIFSALPVWAHHAMKCDRQPKVLGATVAIKEHWGLLDAMYWFGTVHLRPRIWRRPTLKCNCHQWRAVFSVGTRWCCVIQSSFFAFDQNGHSTTFCVGLDMWDCFCNCLINRK